MEQQLKAKESMPTLRLTLIRGPFVMPKKEVRYAEKQGHPLLRLRKIRRPVRPHHVWQAGVPQVCASSNDAAACAENARRVEPSMHG